MPGSKYSFDKVIVAFEPHSSIILTMRTILNSLYGNLLWLSAILTLSLSSCNIQFHPTLTSSPTPDRESLIPSGQVKILPESDLYPPQSFSSQYADPHPLPYPVNTTGAEDSAFIIPDGQTLYLWFTPDPNAPVEEQLVDGVTGIYSFQKLGDGWSSAQRVHLQEPSKHALDGCGFVQENVIYFCSAREGYTGLHWFTAQFREGRWMDWTLVDFPEHYQVGELHITTDGNKLFFHSSRSGGFGGYDIWKSEKVGDGWGEPVNLAVVNSLQSDGWPFITPDGNELWFTRGNGAPELWRSLRVDGSWSTPERMFAPFAGEASLDMAGNVYFTHHFYKDNIMLEADIYVAERIGE